MFPQMRCFRLLHRMLMTWRMCPMSCVSEIKCYPVMLPVKPERPTTRSHLLLLLRGVL